MTVVGAESRQPYPEKPGKQSPRPESRETMIFGVEGRQAGKGGREGHWMRGKESRDRDYIVLADQDQV